MPTEKYPEHAKLRLVSEKSQTIGQFLDTFITKDQQAVSLCVMHKHEDTCRDDDTRLACGLTAGEYVPLRESIEKTLAHYFGIDLVKLDQEKRAMLKELREGAAA